MEITELATLSKGNPFVVLADKAIERGGASELEKLFELAERWEANRARASYNSAMIKAQKSMPLVVADKANSQTKSKYAPLEKVQEICKLIWLQHGFALSFANEDCPTPGWSRIICDVRHEDGHVQRYHRDLPNDGIGPKGNAIGGMNAVQGVLSTCTYGQRTLTLDIFDITVADSDRDGQTQPTVTVEQAQELSDLLAATGGDWVRLLTVSGVEPIPVPEGDDVNAHVWSLLLQVPASRFERSRDLMKRAKVQAKVRNENR